jgi:hypothetical protein
MKDTTSREFAHESSEERENALSAAQAVSAAEIEDYNCHGTHEQQ